MVWKSPGGTQGPITRELLVNARKSFRAAAGATVTGAITSVTGLFALSSGSK